MKKIGSLLMAMMLTVSLSGCGEKESKKTKKNPMYKESEVLEFVEPDDRFGYLQGNLKALGNYFDYDDTLMLTQDNRLVWPDYDKSKLEIKVPKDVEDIAEIKSDLIILRHDDGKCSTYSYDGWENTCEKTRKNVSLPENSYVSCYDSGTLVAFYNKDGDVVFDIYPPDSDTPNGCTGKMVLDVLVENGIEYSGLEMFLPKGENSAFFKEGATGRIFVSTLGKPYVFHSLYLTNDYKTDEEYPEFDCSGSILLENCDKIWSDAGYPYYTLTDDTTHLYRAVDSDDFSERCISIELPAEYSTADIEEVLGVGGNAVIRMKDGKVLSSKYDSTAAVLNPELTEFYKDANIADYMLTEDDIYYLMDDNHLYTLNSSVIYKY